MVVLIYTKEVYKPLTYPGVKKGVYEISNYGKIRNIKTGNIKKPFEHKEYLRIALANDPEYSSKDQTNRSIHRLVAWEFCKGYKEGYIPNHLDSNTKNNFAGNLEWVSSKMNSIYGVFEGNIKCGEDHYLNVFSKNEVIRICEFLQEGYSNMQIMKTFGFHNKSSNPQLYKLIDHIRHRRSWKTISCNYNF